MWVYLRFHQKELNIFQGTDMPRSNYTRSLCIDFSHTCFPLIITLIMLYHIVQSLCGGGFQQLLGLAPTTVIDIFTVWAQTIYKILYLLICWSVSQYLCRYVHSLNLKSIKLGFLSAGYRFLFCASSTCFCGDNKSTAVLVLLMFR